MSDFYIDRMFGGSMLIEVEDKVVRPFYDHEYNNKLSAKCEGQSLQNLERVIDKCLHKTWLKHWALGKLYLELNLSDIQFKERMFPVWIAKADGSDKTHLQAKFILLKDEAVVAKEKFKQELDKVRAVNGYCLTQYDSLWKR